MAKRTEITSEGLRRNVGDVLKRVAYAGEEFIVTVHGKPAAKLGPVDDDEKKSKVKKAD